MKKFDILVYNIEEDDNGHQRVDMSYSETANGVMAENANALVQMYKRCDQSIKIVREYEDDECKNYGKLNINGDSGFNGDSSKLGAGKLMTSPMLTTEMREALQKQQNVINVQPSNSQEKIETNNIQIVKNENSVSVVKNEPPKYFTVGGIKCKMENGKMYQKQWVRLNDNEMSEVRIIADKTNKICTLKDKHVEVLKWILTEDSIDSNSDSEGQQLILG